MEVEDRETTDSGSLSGNPELDSPSTGGGSFGRSEPVGGGVPGVLNMNISMEMNAAAATANTPTLPVGSGIVGGIVGVGLTAGRGRGNGDSSTGKKKRGRPRKYDAEGNLNPAYIKPSPTLPAGFTLSTPPSYEVSSGPKRGRGRPAGSGNWQVLASLGDLFVNTAGGNFTPHVVTVEAGEDVAGKILTFAQKGHQGICVLSANGPVSNVTLRQPGSSGGLLTYEGRFEILTLTGSYTVSDNNGIKSRSGGLSVSLASPDGRVIGGGVAGMLTAASPIQIVVGSFVPNGFKMQKRKTTPVSPASAPRPLANVTAATPISQAPPETGNNIHNLGISPLLAQKHGEGNHIINNRDLANSDTTEWNGSGPPISIFRRPSPDINIPMPEDDQ